MHPHLKTLTPPHQFSCEGCWRGLLLDPDDLDFADRHTVRGIEKLVDRSGWTVEEGGTARCPNLLLLPESRPRRRNAHCLSQPHSAYARRLETALPD
jgi:hypothetical protein